MVNVRTGVSGYVPRMTPEEERRLYLKEASFFREGGKTFKERVEEDRARDVPGALRY